MRRVLVISLAVALLAGCGGGDDSGEGGSKSAESVIREWADTLRSGDVRGAAEFFALPSVVANGASPSVLYTARTLASSTSRCPAGRACCARPRLRGSPRPCSG